MSKQEHTRRPWLLPLGKLVSAAGNRDASVWEQGEQVAAAHTELFNELRRMDEMRAELLGVAEHCRDLLMRYEINRVNGEEIADEALAKLNEVIAKARGES